MSPISLFCPLLKPVPRAWLLGVILATAGMLETLPTRTSDPATFTAPSWRSEIHSAPLSHASSSQGYLQRALAAMLDFLVPAAHADLFRDPNGAELIFESSGYYTVACCDTNGPYQIWNDDPPGFDWSLQGFTGYFKLYDEQSYTSPFVVYPGAGNNNALTIAGSGSVGVGTDAPARQLHLKGPNAVFRMDRPYDTAAFLIVRTDAGGTPLKTFVVGTNATGSNNGEFVINDLGAAVEGAGSRRMTIGNTGNVTFTGSVTAAGYYSSSSARFKKDIETLSSAGEALEQLRGVRFAWKDSGQPSVGLIAEEVAKIYPELVEFENGEAKGVNYSALVAVLVEAMKEQHVEFEAAKKQQQAELETVSARLAALERLLIGKQAMLTP